MKPKTNLILLCLSLLLISLSSWAQNDSLPSIHYGSKGWQVTSADGHYMMHAQLRMQFRYSYPFEQDPVSLDDFNKDSQHILQIRRGRAKVGGHVFSPKLTFYMEFELANSNLLDYRLTYDFHPAFQLLIGQYKARYNTERVVSSGKLQTADRSILTREFTIDRQTGITLMGNPKGDKALNFSYWVSVFSGTGRGGFVQDEENLMWMVRGQWNMFGEVMPFVSSDIDQSKIWRGYIAGGWTTNESKFTRFSQSGGGQIEGYPAEGENGQYKIDQFFVETAFKKSGFSWQQEFHQKRINDQINQDIRTLIGNYLQLGTFPATYIRKFPQKLELAFRYAFYFNDTRLDNTDEEFTGSINWFFKGHQNKLTAEASFLDVQESENINSGWRFRLQWDVSF